MKNLFKYWTVLFVVLLVGWGGCQQSSINDKIAMNFSKDTYKKKWDQMDGFVKQGLPKSALEVVNQIYEEAKKDNNPSQVVKAVIHKLKFQAADPDYDFPKNIEALKKEITLAEFPVKPVLHSMLAEMYWNYYQQNRYRFLDRTAMDTMSEDDVRTWDLRKISAEAVKNYRLSLEDSEQSQKVPVDFYEAILLKENEKIPNGRKFRPTLYDFLAHRTVDFFMNEETGLAQPGEQAVFNDADYFLEAEAFIQKKIQTTEADVDKFYALKVLQDLMRFHLHDDTPDSLVDVDLKRLMYVKQNAVLENKDDLYRQALEKMESRYLQSPISGEIAFQLAAFFYENSQESVQPIRPLPIRNIGNSRNKALQPMPVLPPKERENKHQMDAAKALEICNTLLRRFAESDGALNCKHLQHLIKTKNFEFVVENVQAPAQPFLARITYKNVPKLYFRIIKTSREEAKNLKKTRRILPEIYEEKLIDFYAKKEPVEKFSVDLPDEKDYQQHSTEVKMPALPLGQYLILIGTTENMKYKGEAVAFDFVDVSNLSYIHRTLKNGTMEFSVLHRQTGEPLPGVTAQVWLKNYDYSEGNYQNQTGSVYTTDKDGHLEIPHIQNPQNFSLEFRLGEDTLFSNDPQNEYSGYFYQTGYNGRSEPYPPGIKTFFFTDRAIYRPGQTIYFKGVVLENNALNGDKTNKILTQYPVTVTFYDVNSQKVADVAVVTNEYGSFSGTFTAPSQGLNGQMYLNDTHGYAYFAVEDYKRPKFEVTFDKLENEFKLGEEVELKGKAEAYSGANIDQATVHYRVVRKARFPYWWFCWYGGYPTSPELEITNGNVKTDLNGAFRIKFPALPDLSVSPDSKPTFTYTVYADVTDSNGETRSSSQEVNLGYSSLLVKVEIPATVDGDQPQEFPITTTNLNGDFQAAQGMITIHKLKNPDKAYRQPLWNKPDQPLLSKEAFSKNFPNDIYEDEDNFFKWEKQEKILDVQFNTAQTKILKIEKMQSGKVSWAAGQYLLEITGKDKDGQEVKEVSYFTIYNGGGAGGQPGKTLLPYPTYDFFVPISMEGEPGENAKILVGSSGKIQALYELEQGGKIIHKEWIHLDNETRLLLIPIQEAYRGNIGFHYTFVVDGRLYQHDEVIIVPYTNKALDIIFETFRDKLEPGQKEEWKLKIKGKQGEKVAAEMVATLYDASLDAFKTHTWNFDIYQEVYASLSWSGVNAFGISNANLFQKDWNSFSEAVIRYYDALNWFGFIYNGNRQFYPLRYKSMNATGFLRQEGATLAAPATMDGGDMTPQEAPVSRNELALLPEPKTAGKDFFQDQTVEEQGIAKMNQDLSGVRARTNFNETAFFYPHLKTDANGEIIISFTVPEALTRWKMWGFAHTKDLKYGLVENELITQKDLMVVSNAPRFFREGDTISFPAKITNLAENDLKGEVQLELFDAVTMKPLQQKADQKNQISSVSMALAQGKETVGNTAVLQSAGVQTFEVKKGESVSVQWDLKIPQDVDAITYKVVAKAGNFSDGEEMTVPVLTNRMLVTETLPLAVRDQGTKTFTFEKLLKNTSSTLNSRKLTLEYTSNPAWYAVQALPYLMEYPYECAEQVFSRFYANSLASHVANTNPKIKAVFDEWKRKDADALLSNLEKNQELKSLLLQETPWVREAQNETEQKKRIALLFDLNKMSNEQAQNLLKLQNMQASNGAWPWFQGMPEDRYITQHIVAGLGHLYHLGVLKMDGESSSSQTLQMTKKSIGYLDKKIKEDYDELKRLADAGEIKLAEKHLGYTEIHYLYARSYFVALPIPTESKEAFDYFKGQAQKYWLQDNLYMEGMIALALNRYGDESTPLDIVKSLREQAALSEEMGMYFNYQSGFYWYQAPIETQSLMIEVFDEIAHDQKAVDDLKVWLLKQKQTKNWPSTKATAEAIYALLLKGSDWLTSEMLVEITVGDQTIDPKKMDDLKVEAGTGYFKTSWDGTAIKNGMGKITVTKKDNGVSWGAMYWQYFEQLDKITFAKTPLALKKQLYLQKDSPKGPILTAIDDKTALAVGDLVKVRLELRVDRDMEYVQMKDMRASAFEPLNVLSVYKYQDGLGYYESTRDAATNFFFARLPKGTYVFEYPLRVTYKGDFSNGITTIQSMYAPEFTSHSEGVRVKVTGNPNEQTR